MGTIEFVFVFGFGALSGWVVGFMWGWFRGYQTRLNEGGHR